VKPARFREIEIQLHLTNLADEPLIFPTFQAFGLKVVNAEGKKQKVEQQSVAAKGSRPLCVAPGASYCLYRQAFLRWDSETNSATLSYYPSTDELFVYGPLSPGKYKLSFWYSPPLARKQDATASRAPRSAWTGRVVTRDVPFEVVAPREEGRLIRRRPHAVGQGYPVGVSPTTIFNSKPLRKNGASFVIVTERRWVPVAHADKSVLLDAQLHLTNNSDRDMFFPTFDSFGLSVATVSGTQIWPDGGRDATRLTRPVIIAPGTTFCLHPRAELHWRTDTRSAALLFYDGTGALHSYEPLRPGPYKVAFWYSPRDARAARVAVQSAHRWSGTVATHDLRIDLSQPD
jgi:hypothetical protein